MERKSNLLILKHILSEKEWEFEVDNNGELTFILGNQEPSTNDMTDEEVSELLDVIEGW